MIYSQGRAGPVRSNTGAHRSSVITSLRAATTAIRSSIVTMRPAKRKSGVRATAWKRRAGASRRGFRELRQEALEHRVAGIPLGEAPHVAARLVLERDPAPGVARSFARQRRGEHPGRFDPGEVAFVRH